VGGYEGTIPAVFTRIWLEVKNRGGCQLHVSSKWFLSRIFSSRQVNSGDPDFDLRFSFKGQPAEFLQRAMQLIVHHPILLDRPDEVIMLTDYPLSWVNWSRPSIHLEGGELVCMQSGVPTQVSGQISMLDLLCDLAELAEKSWGGRNNG
jgi:hypothetical protein